MRDRIKVVGYIQFPESENMESVMVALSLHIEATLAEPGCISFEVKPSLGIAGRLDVSEEFLSSEAFEYLQERTRSSDWAVISKNAERSYKVEA